MNNWFCIGALILLCFGVCSAAPLHADAWQALLTNDPLEAQRLFTQALTDAHGAAAGSAYRGLALVNHFMGNDGAAMTMTFKAFLADRDTLLFDAAWIRVLPFGRAMAGHGSVEGYQTFKLLTAQPGLLRGEHFSVYADRLINDGKLSAARSLLAPLGIVRNFKMIGPFENISGSGYRRMYKPETELDFHAAYNAKDGARVTWFDFNNENHNGWVFTENNYGSDNAVVYYYAKIVSDKAQEAFIGFGASGAFKVFFNDNCVLADSVFRNTGADMFIQPVTLRAGDNKLLVKIGHEEVNSNFLVRVVDSTGCLPEGVHFSAASGTFFPDTFRIANTTASPSSDRMIAYLSGRLARDSSDHEAAVSLMDFYNTTEQTDQGQALAQHYLRRFPQSSLWLSMYGEALTRSGNFTGAQSALTSASRQCSLNNAAWQHELDVLSQAAGSRDVIDFIEKSPESFRRTPEALLVMMAQYLKLGNESQLMKTIEVLEKEHKDAGNVAEVLAAFYAGRGHAARAEKILLRLIKYQRSATGVYRQLADIYLKQGRQKAALKTYERALTFSPMWPGAYYYLGTLMFQLGDYHKAHTYTRQALAMMPTAAPLHNLEGAIVLAQGKKDDAIAAYSRSIGYAYNNFSAWDQLLPLKGLVSPSALCAMPSADTVASATSSWSDRDAEDGAILSYCKDVVMYPSRCSRERSFLMVRLPTQAAIDAWKEYTIPYNGHYQTLQVSRSFTRSHDGRETPADVGRNVVAFKALNPGDCIVLEWSLDNYYTGDMAQQVWGDHAFELPFPVFQTRLRLITPQSDTIAWRIQGDSIAVSNRTDRGFTVTDFVRGPYRNPPEEMFALVDPPQSHQVFYSTFGSWADIVTWYRGLTENKQEQTALLRALADSLFIAGAPARENVARMQEYLTGAVRYSFVPFRQSAWVPQPAREVLAARMGDCKDMSSLAKSLLDHAGIASSLVLVNTRDQNSPFAGYIGPAFNHCIVAWDDGGTQRFLDLTDNHLSAINLPKMDQGALALVIQAGNDSLIHLPLDTPPQRFTSRIIAATVDTNGAVTQSVATLRTGILAGQMRAAYRFVPYREQVKSLRSVLQEGYPDVAVDTLWFEGLDRLGDTLRYTYTYRARSAGTFSSNTVIVPLNIPDQIRGDQFPGDERRTTPVDMTGAWYDVGLFTVSGELVFPARWRPITVPRTVELKSAWGHYRLSFVAKGNRLTFSREATFDFRQPVMPQDAPQVRAFLSTIAKADNIQLMFFTE